MKERYKNQKAFSAIGEKGQKCLRDARVAIIGLGGLGTIIATELARAGVGYLRLIDRAAVVIGDLQCQFLYSEEDARQNLFKARAAAEQLGKINSEITLEPLVADFNPHSCENILVGLDLVIAAVDNDDTRLCINQACHQRGIPWIQGAVQGSRGITMNILPGQTACYHCFLAQQAPVHSNNQVQGILNMIVGLIGSFQAAEALKILLKDQGIRKTTLFIDVWQNSYQEMPRIVDPNCPVCAQRTLKPVD